LNIPILLSNPSKHHSTLHTTDQEQHPNKLIETLSGNAIFACIHSLHLFHKFPQLETLDLTFPSRQDCTGLQSSHLEHHS